jgi:serine/threonine protein kinase
MPELEEGRIFERYQVSRVLGSGISGRTYEAIDIVLQRKVVLKLIHPWLLLPVSARRQFFREMHSLSTITHPYLASTLDYGEVDGQLYIARRYVSASSLLGNEGRLWYSPPLPITDAIHYACQIAQVLQHLHDHGAMHGSLTFSNILVLLAPTPDRKPDFAPFLLADVGTTHFVRRFGQPKVTLLPVTAAPEQLGKRAIPASDQYALAVLLYFWIAGCLPFIGTPEEIEQLKLTETITSPSCFNAAVTAEQDKALRRALSVYPEERYPSVLTFARTLLASLNRRPTVGMPPALTPIATKEHEPASSEPLMLPPSEEPTKEAPEQSQDELEIQEQQNTQPCLVITSPYSQEPWEIPLEAEVITLGRAGSSDILLDRDNLTSRHHALLKYDKGQYVIFDRRSATGIYINRDKLVPDRGWRLSDGDHITIGVYKLVFYSKMPQGVAR